MSITSLLLNPDAFRLNGTVELGSNGANAKTAPVKIVANSGKPYHYDSDVGTIVYDMASMKHATKIPLDYAHSAQKSNGFLNKFEIDAQGQLICSGAIVIADQDTNALVINMREGVPYQASIESHGGTLELVSDGETALVNGNEVTGPLTIVRDWKLAAVGICKFGRDRETSSEIYQNAKKNSERQKVLFVATSNQERREMEKEQVKVDPAAEVAKTVEAPVVEAPKAETDVKVEPVVEKAVVKAEAEKAVDAVKTDAPEPVLASANVASVDPRAQFKLFKSTFGAEQGGKYFENEMSFESALGEHLKFQGALMSAKDAKIAELEKRIQTIQSSLGSPVPVLAAKTSAEETKEEKKLVRWSGSKPAGLQS